MGTPYESLMAVCCCVPERVGWSNTVMKGLFAAEKDAAGSIVTSRSREEKTVRMTFIHGQFIHAG